MDRSYQLTSGALDLKLGHYRKVRSTELTMQKEIRIAVVAVLVLVALPARGTRARQPPQQSQDKCSEAEYRGRLTSTHRYRLNRIEGQAVYGAVSDKGELQSASGICVSLFNRKNQRFVANVRTEPGGQFQFTNVAPGEYVLIVSISALHEIIIPVEPTNSRLAKGNRRRQLLLHLRAKEDQRKSFVTAITEPALREELRERVRKDQAVRNDMIRNGADRSDKAIEAREAVIDSENTGRLKEIIKRYGWPGPELVGQDGADAAFLLVQHSPDFDFQKAMLSLVQTAYENGKLTAWSYALLVDRVCVRGGKPQVYGMAVNHWQEREPVLDPIEDEANVDKRRAKIGLPPLREYLEGIKKQYFPK